MNMTQIPFARPWITDDDRSAVQDVLQGPILAHGPQAEKFEAEFAAFLGAGASCVATSSCMAALHLAYLHLGIGPGDEVVVPALTHVATAHAVEITGARAVFADCEAGTGNVTAATIERALSARTRAVSVVHFAGLPCGMEEIVRLASSRDLWLVEDCALAVGARWRGTHVGLWGDVGCFSFYPVKHLTTGEGGMFATRHEEVARTVARRRAFGVDRSHAERRVPGQYDVTGMGLNYRLGEMQAALGRSQLARVDENLRRRRANFERLREALSGRPGLRVLDARAPESQSGYYCLVVVLEAAGARRDEVVARLALAGVGTSLYYPHPVPRLRYYREKYGWDPERYAGAARISDGSIALPVGPHLGPAEIERVAESLLESLDAVNE